MEIKDFIYVVGGLVAIVASHFRLNTKIDVVSNDLKNHTKNHEKLEARVNEHEDKIDNRLETMNNKIDNNHREVIGMLTDIKIDFEKLRR